MLQTAPFCRNILCSCNCQIAATAPPPSPNTPNPQRKPVGWASVHRAEYLGLLRRFVLTCSGLHSPAQLQCKACVSLLAGPLCTLPLVKRCCTLALCWAAVLCQLQLTKITATKYVDKENSKWSRRLCPPPPPRAPPPPKFT